MFLFLDVEQLQMIDVSLYAPEESYITTAATTNTTSTTTITTIIADCSYITMENFL